MAPASVVLRLSTRPLQIPMDPEGWLSMLFSDVLTLVVALVVIAALGWTVARLWGPIADYVRYDRGGEEH